MYRLLEYLFFSFNSGDKNASARGRASVEKSNLQN